MYGFGVLGLSEVQLSISELSVVGGGGGGGGWTRQTHFMVGPGRGPTKTKKLDFWRHQELLRKYNLLRQISHQNRIQTFFGTDCFTVFPQIWFLRFSHVWRKVLVFEGIWSTDKR